MGNRRFRYSEDIDAFLKDYVTRNPSVTGEQLRHVVENQFKQGTVPSRNSVMESLKRTGTRLSLKGRRSSTENLPDVAAALSVGNKSDRKETPTTILIDVAVEQLTATLSTLRRLRGHIA